MAVLSAVEPELAPCVFPNPAGELTIDFSDPRAVLLLNRALIKKFYSLEFWTIPEGSLCPPVPGRADYIHYAADLLAGDRGGEIPRGKGVHLLDIGTGASCIFPIIGTRSYGWKFTASETDLRSLKVAGLIVESNKCLAGKIVLKCQKERNAVFRNIIGPGDRFDLTVCNPPFYSSPSEALEANRRKQMNLGISRDGEKDVRNFGGTDGELWCPGGEAAFIGKMIDESPSFGTQVCWFTSLVSRSVNLPFLETRLKKLNAAEIRIIPMAQGQKQSRILAWTFFPKNNR